MKSAMEIVQIDDIYGLMKIKQKEVKNPNSKAKYIPSSCLCECIKCGKQYYKRPVELLNGKGNSCRCQTNKATSQRNKEKSSVKVGNIYNNIVVLEDLGFRTQTRGRKESWYRCKCLLCGREDYEINGTNVKNVKSCGCQNSLGENLIEQILKQNNINYSKEYSFKDLYDKSPNHPLRFDFAIFDIHNQLKALIEFDGRQHTKGPEGKWCEKTSLQEIQYKDKLKDDYCKKQKLNLIRISYKEISKISLNYLKEKGAI